MYLKKESERDDGCLPILYQFRPNHLRRNSLDTVRAPQENVKKKKKRTSKQDVKR